MDELMVGWYTNFVSLSLCSCLFSFDNKSLCVNIHWRKAVIFLSSYFKFCANYI